MRAELTERNRALAERYPLYPQLAPAARLSEPALFQLDGVSVRRGDRPSCRAST